MNRAYYWRLELSDPHLIVEKQGHVVTLTMNRPEAKNAFSLEMMAQMADAWTMIDEDREVRVAILTGADNTFSAGADLKLMHHDQTDNPWHKRFKDEPDLHWKALLRHYRVKKPLIAAVEGFAFGGGTEILQATDIRVSGRSAQFGITEARWGLFPLGGSTVRLRRQIPFTKAMEMLLTARPISAEEAERIGLIGRIVDDGKALEAAQKIAKQIASNGPMAVQAIKASVLAGEGLTEEDALAKELKLGWPCLSSHDAKEGTRAFTEKRRPEFKGE